MNDDYYVYGRNLYRIEGLKVAKYRVVGLSSEKMIRVEDKYGVEFTFTRSRLDEDFSISRIEMLMKLKIQLQDALDEVEEQYYDFLQDFTQKIHRKDKTEWHKKS